MFYGSTLNWALSFGLTFAMIIAVKFLILLYI
jgi:hypothetical protein